LSDRGMPQQRLLDLRPRDVVAGADDHVVGPCLVAEIAVAIAHVDVAGDVPALPYVSRLAIALEVAATCRPLHRQASELTVAHRSPFRVLDLGQVARHGAAGAAGPDLAPGR